jgi:hypothetical protein
MRRSCLSVFSLHAQMDRQERLSYVDQKHRRSPTLQVFSILEEAQTLTRLRAAELRGLTRSGSFSHICFPVECIRAQGAPQIGKARARLREQGRSVA